MNLLLRRDPYTLVDEMFDAFSNRAMLNAPARLADGAVLTRARLDVVERGDAYEIKVDMPGVKKGDIQIDLNDNHVSISAACKQEREVKDDERAIYTERLTAQYARSFDLPQPVVEDKADAVFEDGVLTLRLPKKKAQQGKRLAIR
jgi:HSP20 family protein